MRAILVVSFLALLCPAAAMAQTTPATATPRTAPAGGDDITRDQFVERAMQRAKRSAEKRFDRMDTNHDGVLTAGERRGARAQRRSSSPQ